jgi:hypothetical protein
MSVRDIYHNHVVNALIKDGWSITDDPLRLRIGKKDMFVDIGAERLLQAEKGQIKIAVEIKSFVGPSDLNDLHEALGQYILYHDVLQALQPDRILYLAVRDKRLRQYFRYLSASCSSKMNACACWCLMRKRRKSRHGYPRFRP